MNSTFHGHSKQKTNDLFFVAFALLLDISQVNQLVKVFTSKKLFQIHQVLFKGISISEFPETPLFPKNSQQL